MKLQGIRKLGRYQHKETGQQVNVHKGRIVNRTGDAYFFRRSGERVIICEADFFHDWSKISD
jgi:hypothetical protein